MSGNPYRIFNDVSHSKENAELVERIILSLLESNLDDNIIDKMCTEFKEKIKWLTFRDVEAMQFAVYYIAKKAICTKFREKCDFTIVY
jgi:hypothetical protein